MRFSDWCYFTESFNQQVLDYYSTNIAANLRSPYFTLEELAESIYRLLTTKTKDPHRAFLMKFGQLYDQTVRSLEFPNYDKLAKGNNWVFFTPKIQQRPAKIGIGQQGQYVYGVDFKRYATFSSQFLDNNPSMPEQAFNHAWSEVRSFLGMLTGLSQRLWKLSQQYGDWIQFKVNDSLRDLLEHMDNIVVHYHKPELGPEVEAALRESAREVGVRLDPRQQRGWKG